MAGFELGDRADAPRSAASTHAERPIQVEQVVADVLAQELHVGLVVDLVADHAHPHAEVAGVADVLPVDADAAQGRLADQERQVEPGEQAGGERVGAGGHVHHDVLARPVDEVVEQQLDRADLGVVAGHAEVLRRRTAPVTASRTPPTSRTRRA